MIRRRFFTEGSLVRRGQPLYEIDPRLYRAAVNQAQANLASARANQEALTIQADRYKPLAAIEAVSKQEYTNAIASARQATASVAQTRAALDTARDEPAIHDGTRADQRPDRPVAVHRRCARLGEPDRSAGADPAARPDLRRYPAIRCGPAVAAPQADAGRRRADPGRSEAAARGRQRLRLYRHGRVRRGAGQSGNRHRHDARTLPQCAGTAAAGHVRTGALRAGDQRTRLPGAARPRCRAMPRAMRA